MIYFLTFDHFNIEYIELTYLSFIVSINLRINFLVLVKVSIQIYL